MKFITFGTALFFVFQASVFATPNRTISPRIKHLASTATTPICNYNEVPYCYLFPALVDIDSGYLRVWKADVEDNWYVAGQLEKGDVIYIRGISKDKKYGYITVLTTDCMSAGCMGRVELRYLR